MLRQLIVVAQSVIGTIGEIASREGDVGSIQNALGGSQSKGGIVVVAAVGLELAAVVDPGGSIGVPQDAEGSVEGLPDLGATVDPRIKEVDALTVQSGPGPAVVGLGLPVLATQRLVDVLAERSPATAAGALLGRGRALTGPLTGRRRRIDGASRAGLGRCGSWTGGIGPLGTGKAAALKDWARGSVWRVREGPCITSGGGMGAAHHVG